MFTTIKPLLFSTFILEKKKFFQQTKASLCFIPSTLKPFDRNKLLSSSSLQYEEVKQEKKKRAFNQKNTSHNAFQQADANPGQSVAGKATDPPPIRRWHSGCSGEGRGGASPPSRGAGRGRGGRVPHWLLSMVLLERLRRTFWKRSSVQHTHTKRHQTTVCAPRPPSWSHDPSIRQDAHHS